MEDIIFNRDTFDDLIYDGSSFVPAVTPVAVLETKDGLVVSSNKAISFMLPVEYEKVPYLQVSGTQFINTGFVPTTSFKHVLTFEITSNANSNKYICGTGVNEGRSGNLRVSSNTLNGLYIGTSSAVSIINNTTITLNTKYTIIMDLYQNATNTVQLNGTDIANTNKSTVSSTKQLQLFALSSSYFPTGVRIYSSLIRQNGHLVYYLIPARRKSDQVLGMYDLIQGRFLTNAGSGSFITE